MTSPNTIHIVAADHPVKSVVVLKSSKAEVVRTFHVALKGGQNKLIISKLPSTIVRQSVRISGFNPGASKDRTYLSDVVCSDSGAPDDALNEAICALEDQKSLLESEKRVHDAQAEVLVKYANSLSGEHASPDVMTEFLSDFIEQGKQNVQVIAKLVSQIKGIDKQIEEEKKKSSLLKGSTNTELTAVIVADNDVSLNLKLTYIVNETNWAPTYELHAVTGENGQPSRTVSLHYRACITQSTGEDWTDAALILSTVATDTIIKRIPKSESIMIRVTSNYNSFMNRGGLFGNQSQTQPTKSQFGTHTAFGGAPLGGAFGANATGAPSGFGSSATAAPGGLFGGAGGSLFGSTAAPAPPPPPPPPASGSFGSTVAPAAPSTFGSGHSLFGSAATPAPRAVSDDDGDVIALPDDEDFDNETGEGAGETPAKLVTQTPMALTYTVRGKSSIPSDGKEHIVTIAILPFETDVEYVSVPRTDPRVYLQCQVKNNSDYRLLPGPVSIILDDSYVSKTTISDVNRNDTFNFTLGDDPSVHIAYSRLFKTAKEGKGTFADIVNVTTYTTTITVQNKHNFPIEKLILRDAIPISDDKRVKVVLRKPKELIEAKEGSLVEVQGEKEKLAETNSGEESGDDGDEESGNLKVKWEKEKEGLYEYQWRVDADDKIKLETVFEMKASADLSCSFLNPVVFGKKA